MPNPHLNRVPREDMDEETQAVWDLGMERSGEAAVVEVFANSPAMMDWYFEGFYKQIFYSENPNTKLDVRTKELLRLKLSKQHGCYFCNRWNSVDAMNAGITQEQIDNIPTASSEHFDEKDMAVIALAEQMMLQNMHGELTKNLYGRLKQYYSDEQVVEMGFVAAVLTGMAKYLFVFDLVTKEEVCPVVPQAAE
ncbi:MAG: carboxymuconolactone decarboxylase family protein [Rhodospirillaceae bacterium]